MPGFCLTNVRAWWKGGQGQSDLEPSLISPAGYTGCRHAGQDPRRRRELILQDGMIPLHGRLKHEPQANGLFEKMYLE